MPVAESARAVGGEKKGRTPLKAYEVVFFHKSARDAALANPLDVPPLPSGTTMRAGMGSSFASTCAASCPTATR